MIKNGDVTVWHYSQGEWCREYFPDAWIFMRARGEKDKGLTTDTDTTVRIFTAEQLDIKPGDRIAKGNIPDARPPKSSEVMTIIEVTDNRVGSAGTKHRKVVCE